jgi:hypothetical protein
MEHRTKYVSAAHSPLGFFVLALFIVEGFLLGAGRLFDLPPTARLVTLGMGVGLFLLVLIVVTVLVIWFPKNLVFGEESHINYARMQRFGSDQQSVSAADLVEMTPMAAPAITQQQPTPQLPQAEQGESQ